MRLKQMDDESKRFPASLPCSCDHNSSVPVSLNPYTASSLSAANHSDRIDFDVGIDSSLLVVGRYATLPDFCVVTDVPVSADNTTPKTVRGSIWGDLRPRRCEIAFGMSEPIRRKYRRRLILLRIWQAFSCCMTLWLWFYNGQRLPLFLLCPLFLANAAMLSVPMSPLRIVKFNRGRYWITGCGTAFLQRLKRTKNPS